MATSSLVALSESLLNQTTAVEEVQAVAAPAAPSSTTATADTAAATTISGASTTAGTAPATGVPHPESTLDRFVPSSQTGAANATAEAAGLFTATQIPLFSEAAGSLLGQSAAPQAGLANPVGTATAAANAPPASTASAGTAAPTAGALSIPAEPQTLNNLLAGLGLSATDIQKVDRAAGLVNDFNPTAYGTLISQLESLAHSTALQIGQTPAAKGAAANSPAAGTRATATAAPTRTATTPSAGDGSLTLQGVQVQLTFADSSGQSAQVVTTARNTNPAPPPTKALTT